MWNCSKRPMPLCVVLSIILIAAGLVFVLVAIVTPGWVRDRYFHTFYGLWWMCGKGGSCKYYSGYSVPVRGMLIISEIFGLLCLAQLLLLVCYWPGRPLYLPRIANFIASCAVLTSIVAYSYNKGYAGGSDIDTYFHYSYALAWLGFASLALAQILLMLEKFYDDPLEIYNFGLQRMDPVAVEAYMGLR